MKTSYEVQTLQRGRWKISSIFDDMELAVYEARRIDNMGRFSGVRVIKEDIEGNPFATEVRAQLSVVYVSDGGGETVAVKVPQAALPPDGAEPTLGNARDDIPLPIPEFNEDGDLVSPRSGGSRRRRKHSGDTILYVVIAILVAAVAVLAVLVIMS